MTREAFLSVDIDVRPAVTGRRRPCVFRAVAVTPPEIGRSMIVFVSMSHQVVTSPVRRILTTLDGLYIETSNSVYRLRLRDDGAGEPSPPG